MPGLRLSLLGSPQLSRSTDQQEDAPLRLNRRKAMALLAYLAVTGEAHRREVLATLFWPNHTQSRAHANLRRDLSVLNKALDGDFLDIDRESVSLVRGRDFWLDVDRFRHLLAEFGGHGHSEERVCPKCIPLLSEAVTLYRGDFMAGFTLPDTPDFDEWQFFERENLRYELAGALTKLVQALTAQGQFEAAIPHARRWLGLDLLHEPAHRELMQLYAWAGNEAAALRQYQACVQVLEAELGKPPEETTQRLYEAIRAKQPPAPPGRSQLEPGVSEIESERVAPPHNLPSQPTPFIGRQEELAEIRRLLLDEPACQLLTLVGPGGIGKTRLAAQAAMQALDAFPDGVFFVPLASVSSTELLIPAMASALTFSFQTRVDPKVQLLNYLREKEMLLILDNFEHLLEGARLLSDMLKEAPGIKFLVTSRQRLSLRWEWVREIRGLSYPGTEAGDETVAGPETEAGETLAAVEDYSAVRLFVETARRALPDFSLADQADRRAVVRICQLVEGMPLGLELAAAWVRMMPPHEIAQEIRRNLDFLTSSLRDIPERHRSLRALFEHSWQLLSEAGRSAITRLSVFQGGFRREAAEEVCSASLPLLAALVDKSMLRADPAGRYDMHELLRQYADEKLQETPEQYAEARDKHCGYYAAFLWEQKKHLRGTGQRQALAEIAAEIDNVRAAWAWAVAQAKTSEIAQSLESLHLFYSERGLIQEGEEAFREAVCGVRSAQATYTKPALVLGQLLARQGKFSYRLGLHRKATESLQDSLAIFDRLEAEGQVTAREEKAFSLYYLGEIARKDGELEEAKRLCQASLAIYRESDDRLGMARALRRLGIVAATFETYHEAQGLFQETLELYQAIGDQYGIANTLNDLGIVADGLGQVEEARRLYHECLAIRRQIGTPGGIGASLNNLGFFAFLHGEYTEAKELLQEALAIHREIGDQYHIANCLCNLGAAVCALREYQAAQTYLCEALRLAVEVGAVPIVLDALTGIAMLLALSQPGEEVRAAELFAFALHHPASEIPTKDRAHRGLAGLAAILPPEVMTQARERGKNRNLEIVAAEILGDMG